MGSSCFARGNKDNLNFILKYLEERNIKNRVKLTGTLCNEKCGKGPMMSINGNWFENINQPLIEDLIKEHLNGE